jgi:hypothetical protein
MAGLFASPIFDANAIGLIFAYSAHAMTAEEAEEVATATEGAM